MPQKKQLQESQEQVSAKKSHVSCRAQLSGRHAYKRHKTSAHQTEMFMSAMLQAFTHPSLLGLER